jgi:hypothetical protein
MHVHKFDPLFHIGGFVLLIAWCLSAALHCTANTGHTIKTIYDLGVALCEITVREHPELAPSGQAIDTLCKDAEFLKPFIDEVSGSKKRATMRVQASQSSFDPKPDVSKD